VTQRYADCYISAAEFALAGWLLLANYSDTEPLKSAEIHTSGALSIFSRCAGHTPFNPATLKFVFLKTKTEQALEHTILLPRRPIRPDAEEPGLGRDQLGFVPRL
jgi:hypothetical protein